MKITSYFLLILLILFCYYIFKLRNDLKRERMNVKTVEVVREVKIPGVTKIRYKTITEKQEPKIIERIVFKEIPQKKESESQIPVEDKKPERQDRWLAGISIHGLGSDSYGHSVLGGYSFGNKLDFLAGVSPQADTKYSVQAVARF